MLTKSEFLTALQKEVRILLHLASKIDRAQLDYRPTPKQRGSVPSLVEKRSGATLLWNDG